MIFKSKLLNKEEMKKIVHFNGAMRTMFSKEGELKDLEIIEEGYGIKLNKTRDMINKLDAIAPNRKNNGCLLSWKKLNSMKIDTSDLSDEDLKKGMKGVIGGLQGMIEDLVQIVSWYAPDVSKTLIEEDSNMKTDDSVNKVNQGSSPEEQGWNNLLFVKNMIRNEVAEINNLKYWNIKKDKLDDVLCLGELMHFYWDKIVTDDEINNLSQKEQVELQRCCLVLSLFDIFGKINYDLKTDFVSKTNKEVKVGFLGREKVKKNKFLFTTMTSNLTTIN